MESLGHFPCPDATGRPELGHLFKEIVVDVEKEAESGRETVHRQPAGLAMPDVFKTVGQGEGKLLHCVGASLPDVITADAYGIPPRCVVGGKLHRVHHQAHGRRRWENILVLGDVLFQDIVLQSAAQPVQRHTLFFRHGQVHGPDDGRRAVDGHGRGYPVQGEAVEKGFHVGQRRNRHPAFAKLTLCLWVVGVVAVQSGHVEGDTEAGLTAVQQELEPRVGFLG